MSRIKDDIFISSIDDHVQITIPKSVFINNAFFSLAGMRISAKPLILACSFVNQSGKFRTSRNTLSLECLCSGFNVIIQQYKVFLISLVLIQACGQANGVHTT